MDEQLLIKACKEKDRKAQQKLYEFYGPKMMGICLRYCKNKETARDLLQDGFICVFTHINSYSGTGSFEGWLKRIFINLVFQDYRQKEKKKQVLFEDIGHIPESNNGEASDDDASIEAIPQAILLDFIKNLPEGYRTIFNLYVFEDMSHKEIASSLGITENTSRSQYSRAKAILKKQILNFRSQSKL